MLLAAPAPARTQGVPPGRWIPEIPQGRGVLTGSVTLPSHVGCPPGTTGTDAYSCLSVPNDGSGHGVWIRYGQSGDSGFGFLHALVDHNLDLVPIEVTIFNSAFGVPQPNGRYLYGEYYRSPSGQIDQYVEVYEERHEAANHDGHGLGVVTAYCQGPGHSPEARCPDWVNATL